MNDVQAVAERIPEQAIQRFLPTETAPGAIIKISDIRTLVAIIAQQAEDIRVLREAIGEMFLWNRLAACDVDPGDNWCWSHGKSTPCPVGVACKTLEATQP